MKNNTAIVDTKTKVLTIMFQNEQHTVDLREGDLHDNWNCITDSKGILWDINFSWEDSKGCKPELAIYALLEADGNGYQSTDYDSDDNVEMQVKVLGTREEYFRERRFTYTFDSTSSLTFRLYDELDNVLLKTKKLNKAVDELTTQRLHSQKRFYLVATDANGATKKIE